MACRVAPPVVETRCPAFADLTAAEQSQLARELREILERDPQAITPRIVRDCNTLRNQCRAYQREGVR